jgi:PAS domain-containing protein
LPDQSFPQVALPSLGLFSWSLFDNRLVADENYAAIYGLDPGKLARGMNIESIISLIFEEDREEAARRTHATTLSGKFDTITFNVKRRRSIVRVGAYGRCLRDEAGTPSIFTGAVFELSDSSGFWFNRFRQ